MRNLTTIKWFIGCSGFYYYDWIEKFYPTDLPKSKWFDFYSQHFNTLELNVTFYRFPTAPMLSSWYKKSPSDFIFSVKAPRLITHYMKFSGTKELLDNFYQIVKDSLKEKTGCILFQFPASLKYDNDLLERMLDQLDLRFSNVIEFRNESWWRESVLEMLALHNVTFSGVSFPNLPDQPIVNSPIAYYRFHGVPKLYYSNYEEKEFQTVVNAIQKEQIANEAFIYFNNTADTFAINNAITVQRIIA